MLSRCLRKPSQSSTSIAKCDGAIRRQSSCVTGVKCRSKLPRVSSRTSVLLLGSTFFMLNTLQYQSLVRSVSVEGKLTWWIEWGWWFTIYALVYGRCGGLADAGGIGGPRAGSGLLLLRIAEGGPHHP